MNCENRSKGGKELSGAGSSVCYEQHTDSLIDMLANCAMEM